MKGRECVNHDLHCKKNKSFHGRKKLKKKKGRLEQGTFSDLSKNERMQPISTRIENGTCQS